MGSKYSDIVGKTILVGFTCHEGGGRRCGKKQFFGRIVSAGESCITVQKADGETFTLPPDLSAVKKAGEGEYKLRSTGETVTDPDLVAAWDIYPAGG